MLYNVIIASYGKSRLLKLRFVTLKELNSIAIGGIKPEHDNKKKKKVWFAPNINKRNYSLPKYLEETKIEDADIVITDVLEDVDADKSETNRLVYVDKEDSVFLLAKALTRFGDDVKDFYITFQDYYNLRGYKDFGIINETTDDTIALPLTNEMLDTKTVYDVSVFNFKDTGKTIFSIQQAEEYIRRCKKKRYSSNYYTEPSNEDKKFIIESMRKIKVEESLDGLIIFFSICGLLDRHYSVMKQLMAFLLLKANENINKRRWLPSTLNTNNIKTLLNLMSEEGKKKLFDLAETYDNYLFESLKRTI